MKHRRGRRDAGLFLAEGANSVAEALRANDCVVEVFASTTATGEYAALEEQARLVGVPWHLVSDEAVSSLSGSVSPQGIVAVCRFIDVALGHVLGTPPDVEAGGAVVAPDSPVVEPSRDPILVICADVRDPGNAGTVIRCADAVAAVGVILAGNSVDPYNDKTVRATAGSLFHVPVAIEEMVEAVVAAAKEAGYVVLAADGAGELDVFAAADAGVLDAPVAWLFGNEAWGLPDEVAGLADHRLAIPIFGRAESLNLATAAAVCLYASAGRHASLTRPGTMER